VAAASREHSLPAHFTQSNRHVETMDGLGRQLRPGRVLAIVGQDGIGKTSVAVAVLKKLMGAHDNDVWLIDLMPSEDA